MEKDDRSLKDLVYATERRFSYNYRRLVEDTRITKANKEQFASFIDSGLADGLTKHRLLIYLHWLRVLGRQTRKPFDQSMTRKDVEQILAKIRTTRSYAAWSLEGIKTTLKKYFRWRYDLSPTDPLPPAVRWIRGEKPPNTIRKEDLLTPEEIQKIVDASPHLMHKALITTGYWGALRPGELLTMRMGDVIFKKTEVVLRVSGKTSESIGPRDVFVYEPFNLLRAWIASHPFSSHRGSPLWVVSKHQGNSAARTCPDSRCTLPRCLFGKPISLRFYRYQLIKLAKKAGVQDKRVYPYLLRHSQGRELYLLLGEALAKKFMGHAPDSRMARVYSHLVDEDVRDAIRRKRGLHVADEREERKNCPRCSHPNEFRASLCAQCSFALRVDAGVQVAVEEEKAREHADLMQRFLDFLEMNPVVKDLMADPAVRQRFVEEQAKRKAANQLKQKEAGEA